MDHLARVVRRGRTRAARFRKAVRVRVVTATGFGKGVCMSTIRRRVARPMAVLGLVAWLVTPVGAAAETLGETLESAYVNSGLLDQNRALLRAADEDVAQAISALRPIIDWTADISRDFSRIRSLARTRKSGTTSANIGI